ncbi:MAG: thermonuclease family protein [Saprospiraceae bacterium]|nr:thermonuclease family protein [Saprospiraceae bacterium]MCF8252532.1 thermonuclease family protein [Saprospiraceae bacterium]MCF8282556.1 thermonuclease family protein [Bacteroidales bacterium]MCF8314141.1 thermonuclease family protein [Saprospiraceae bacterium]MCF8442886.1 thermonuclease family protein [Saprospiraceae bacterium]
MYVEGQCLNLELVKSGLAWHYKKYSKDEAYADAKDAARTARKGLWQDQKTIAPWDWRKSH